jgi:hypothetical protein
MVVLSALLHHFDTSFHLSPCLMGRRMGQLGSGPVSNCNVMASVIIVRSLLIVRRCYQRVSASAASQWAPIVVSYLSCVRVTWCCPRESWYTWWVLTVMQLTLSWNCWRLLKNIWGEYSTFQWSSGHQPHHHVAVNFILFFSPKLYRVGLRDVCPNNVYDRFLSRLTDQREGVNEKVEHTILMRKW